ncbi:MAG: DUF502 domain-containing protein [Bacteroidota bacterium]
MNRLFRYFLQGLLFTVPIFITLYVIYQIISSVGGVVHSLGIHIHPVVDPFIGFFSVIILVIIMGMVGSSLILQPFFKIIDHNIERAPLIKTIYSSVKDLLSAFVGKKKRFNKPVLVMTNRNPEVQKIGFVTNEDLTELHINKEKVAVYLPYSYAFSGMLIIVDRENISLINASSAEVMKFIISGGVTDID